MQRRKCPWGQYAAEYSALADQAYNIASRSLDLALEDPSWSALEAPGVDSAPLPPAVILDETVLSNVVPSQVANPLLALRAGT